MEPRVTAPLILCGVCQYPVRSVETDFEPDGDHAPCAHVLEQMDAEFSRRRLASSAPVWSAAW